MKNLFEDFPSQEELLSWYGKNGSNIVHDVNAHFHTPYSFSAFSEMKEVFQLAEKEKVEIIGINDFYTTAGYEEFTELCELYHKFPLYNIEFMGLMKDEQEKGIRINDPNNPGRIYFCGKGLDFPVIQDSDAMMTISKLSQESLIQTREMVEKTSAYLTSLNPKLELNFEEILQKYTKGMLRERHIAKVVRIKVFESYTTEAERKAAFTMIFGGKECSSDLKNTSALEDEIRSRLLKTGGPGFVKEDEKAFLPIEEIIDTIHDAGGIPCYPILCDDKNDNFTDFERVLESLYLELRSKNIYAVELIPGRNSFARVKEYSTFFHDRKFIVLFGTEHNSPEMIPLKVDSRGGKALDEELNSICFEGACIVAAHQYLRSKKMDAYIDSDGKPKIAHIDEFIELGNAVIEFFLQQN